MSHRTTAFILFYYIFKPPTRVQVTLTPGSNSHEVLKNKVFSLQSCSMTGRPLISQWHDMFPTSGKPWSNNSTFFWIPFKTGLRFWVRREWGLVANKASNKKITLLFAIYSQVIINRRQTSKEKGIFTKFSTFDSETDTWMTIVYIFAPSISVSILKQKGSWIALWKRVPIWRDSPFQN